MDMDRLIVLSRGSIVADGTHSQLLRQGGVYAELWRKQSGGFNPVARRPPVQESAELAEAEAGASGAQSR
jgi:ATP-binding cassette subfamily B multidrug efflux pump